MQNLETVKDRINHIEEDLANVKKIFINLEVRNKQKTETAWKDMTSASKDISKLWKGLSVREEIRKQREKN